MGYKIKYNAGHARFVISNRHCKKGGDIASASPLVIDTDGDYFDVPTAINEAANRNEIEAKYFLDPAGIEAISGDNNFLTNLRAFKINPKALTPSEFDAICNPDNDLIQLANQYKKGGISISDFYALKRSLIRKFLGTDIYYVDNTTSPATSGLITYS